MAMFDIFDTIESLRQTGNPFCVATVMRTADATSAKAGAKAAITSHGEILGHLGGACVQRAVRQAAEEAIREGAPRVIRVKPSHKIVSVTDQDGAHLYKSGCPSGGTVDLLIEPYAHPPQIVIFGATPIARAVAAHAAMAGFRVAVANSLDGAPDTAVRFDAEDPSNIIIAETDFVVVASQGQGDLAALRAAFDSPARRVSMVASRRKAQVLTEKLIAAGVPEARAQDLKSPAGLNLGGVDPHEIALSVLAEIVLWRNSATLNNRLQDDEQLA